MSQVTIRKAKPADAKELLFIYKHYVENTAISFEYEVPSVSEFESRIKETLEMYPYLVAVDQGKIVGYAYASCFKARKAYDWSVETTIYLKETERQKGYGRALYFALESELKKQHILNLNACIAYIDQEDEYLNQGSMHFHEKLGYNLVGTFHNSGRKFCRWYDMIWMEKFIGDHSGEIKDFIPYSKITENS